MSIIKQAQILPLDDIRRIPIEDIYNTYVGGDLKKRGRQWWARCDWHGNDSSPSFKIYPDQHKWWCYGCGNGGTAIDLVMAALHCDFRTAAMTIAKDFNLTTQSDYQSRKKLNILRSKQHTAKLFERNFNITYFKLCKLNQLLYGASKNVKICLRYPTIFKYLDEINNILDSMSSADQSVQVGGWRRAKAVFPWI